MVTVGLLVRLAAKPGDEAKVTSLREDVAGGTGTGNDRVVRAPPWTIGVRHLDVPDLTGRQAHVSGRAAEALDRPIRAGAG